MSIGHMVEAAEEDDAIAAAARDPQKRSAKEEDAKVAPHKSKAVKSALKHASRRDPPRDPVKPLARGSFLIWVVMAIGLIWAAGGPGKILANPPWTTSAWERSQTILVKAYEGLTGTPKMQRRTIRDLSRSPRQLATVISALFLALTGFFAAWYVTLHLVGVNLVKGAAVVYRRALRPAGKAVAKAITRARHKARARALARGAEPETT